MRVLLSCLEEGPLNFAEQRDRVRLNFERDMGDALARYRALSKGLQLLYGYSQPDPMEIWVDIGKATKEELAATPFLGRIEPFLGWIRDAIAWLIRFQSRELVYSRVVSVRSLVGEDGWQQGIAKASWDFNIDEDTFPDQRHIRTRSISVFAMSDSDSLWAGAIGLPATGKVRHLDGSLISLDQAFLPSVRFGRITRRDSIRPPELSSASLVHNASPLGTWSLTIEPGASNSSSLSELKDIQLDLDVAVRQSSY
jgi:hypothetical protein